MYLSNRGKPNVVSLDENGDFGQSLLRSEAKHALVDSDDDGGDDGEELPATVKGKKSEGIPDDEESISQEGGDDEGEEDAPDDEGSGKGDDDSESEEELVPNSDHAQNAPVQDERSRGSDKRDRSKTIESYFVNFGGRVVDIDKEGSYKYVLVRMEDLFGNKALLVRGCPHKEGTHCKHADAFARAKAELELRGFKATVLGGGRITRHPSRHQKGQKEGYISIFGYSKTFGTCEDCNKQACSLIKASYPNYGIKWANEGYLESEERKISDSSWTRC